MFQMRTYLLIDVEMSKMFDGNMIYIYTNNMMMMMMVIMIMMMMMMIDDEIKTTVETCNLWELSIYIII